MDPTCLFCKADPETVEHFILDCPELQSVRDPVIANISNVCGNIINFTSCSKRDKLQVVLDIYSIVPYLPRKVIDSLSGADRHCRRLCYNALHIERTKRLAKLPTRKRHGP